MRVMRSHNRRVRCPQSWLTHIQQKHNIMICFIYIYIYFLIYIYILDRIKRPFRFKRISAVDKMVPNKERLISGKILRKSEHS